jgi:hypothetical protein
MYGLLEHLSAARGRVLLAIGGSWITAHRSPMSDRDLFAIVQDGVLDSIRRLTSALPKTDLEVRDEPWLDAIVARLREFEVTINAGPSAFSFWDLRFLARIATGKVLISHEAMRGKVASVERQLQDALAVYLSSYVVSLYEDMLGFLLDDRREEALAQAGELCQRACLLALLQSRLADPSPKWALAMTRESGSGRLRSASDHLFGVLASYPEYEPEAWMRALLNGVNRVIASGMLDRLETTAIRTVDGCDAASLRSQKELPHYCLMGVPGYLTMCNTATGKIALCNVPFVEGLAALP